MRITFKISGESQIYSDMIQNYVKIGKVALLSRVMKKDAKDYKCALLAMDGKNNSFTL